MTYARHMESFTFENTISENYAKIKKTKIITRIIRRPLLAISSWSDRSKHNIMAVLVGLTKILEVKTRQENVTATFGLRSTAKTLSLTKH